MTNHGYLTPGGALSWESFLAAPHLGWATATPHPTPTPACFHVMGESEKGAPGRKPLTAASAALDRMKVRGGCAGGQPACSRAFPGMWPLSLFTSAIPFRQEEEGVRGAPRLNLEPEMESGAGVGRKP